MRYLCLVYYEEAKFAGLSRSEYDALQAENVAFLADLRLNGHFLDAAALEPVHTATTIRVGSGKVSATDGPFAETREQLGGFLLIEARDLNEAIRVAAKMPPARYGCVEVRPVKARPPDFELALGDSGAEG